MAKTKKLLKWLLSASLLPLSTITAVSCDFGFSAFDSSEEEKAPVFSEEEIAQARRNFTESKRQYDTTEAKFETIEEQFNEEKAKNERLVENLARVSAEKEENEAEVSRLDAQLAENKLDYPETWDRKREAAQELESAKKVYEVEKQRVAEIVDVVIAKLEDARTKFENFPKDVNRLSKETYVAHWREFFLYIFGLKLIWGIFTGYRPTFVYQDQAKIQSGIDKYRLLTHSVIGELAKFEGLNFQKFINEEQKILIETLDSASLEIKQAPKNLVVLRERYDKATAAYEKYKSRYLSETQDNVKVPPRSAVSLENVLQDGPEAIEYSASKNQFEGYVLHLTDLAAKLSDAFTTLINRLKLVEYAPAKRDEFNDAKDIFLRAEAREKENKDENDRLKKELEEAKKRAEETNQQLEKLTEQLKNSNEMLSSLKERYYQLKEQLDAAKSDLDKAQDELDRVTPKEEEKEGEEG